MVLLGRWIFDRAGRGSPIGKAVLYVASSYSQHQFLVKTSSLQRGKTWFNLIFYRVSQKLWTSILAILTHPQLRPSHHFYAALITFFLIHVVFHWTLNYLILLVIRICREKSFLIPEFTCWSKSVGWSRNHAQSIRACSSWLDVTLCVGKVPNESSRFLALT